MHKCHNCKVGTMRKPKDDHPSYLECDSCLAIELTYQPQDFQEELHTASIDEEGTIILSVFGGYG